MNYIALPERVSDRSRQSASRLLFVYDRIAFELLNPFSEVAIIIDFLQDGHFVYGQRLPVLRESQHCLFALCRLRKMQTASSVHVLSSTELRKRI